MASSKRVCLQLKLLFFTVSMCYIILLQSLAVAKDSPVQEKIVMKMKRSKSHIIVQSCVFAESSKHVM